MTFNSSEPPRVPSSEETIYSPPAKSKAVKPPYVTYTLLGITVLIFLLQLFTRAWLGFDLPAALGAKQNDLIVDGQLWRLFTPMFLHSTTNLLHIVFNMYALFSFGPGLERFYGTGRYLILYFVAGFVGNVFSFVFSPVASLGASTAIFGLIGAEVVFLYRNRTFLGNRARPALMNLLVIVVLNLFLGFSSGFIDNWGHIGGLIGGVVFAWFGGPLLDVSGSYPNFQVTDQRSNSQSFLVAAAMFVVFAAIVFVTIVQRN